MARYSQTLKQL